MPCDAAELEEAATRGANCNPDWKDVRDSLGSVDFWATGHTFYPFLLTLMTNNFFVGVAVAYFYESCGVINAVYGKSDTWQYATFDSFGNSLYTGPVDTLLQDPALAMSGSLAAVIIGNAYGRYVGLRWPDFVDYLFPWINRRGTGRFATITSFIKRWAFNLLLVAVFKFPADVVTRWFTSEYGRYGSSNQMFTLVVFVIMLLVVLYKAEWDWGRTRWNYFLYALVVIAGPHLALTIAATAVYLQCTAEEEDQPDPGWWGNHGWGRGRLVACSTFMWTCVALVAYSCFVVIGLHHWQRRRLTSAPAGAEPFRIPLSRFKFRRVRAAAYN